jgi:iron(III) transport system permease protein
MRLMVRWRIGVTVLLAAVVGWPLILPFADLIHHPAAWSAWGDAPRILALARTTAVLAAGVLIIDVPLGSLLAVLLYRSDMPGRAALRRIIVVSLFVPLPLLTSAWQAALGGSWLGAPSAGWPWATGLQAAIWVHAAAGLPWIVWLVGQGLCWVEPEVEEDARLACGAWRVLWRVTLPRAQVAIVAAAAWVALLTAHEIAVTDLTQVRTFAEEVYTQFALPDPAGGQAPDVAVARSVAVAAPATLLIAVIVGVAVWRWERTIPPLGSAPDPRPLVALGAGRWPTTAAVLAVLGLFIAAPVGSLVWKLGQHGYPEQWSADMAAQYLGSAARAHSWLIAGSLGAAAVAGLLTAGLALLACWLARDSLAVRVALAAAVALAWAMPGPIVGAGLISAIDLLVAAEERIVFHGPIWLWLYNGPSPLPVVWAYLLRFFPCAVVLIWPAVRLIPKGLTDAARVDGAAPAGELRHAIWPLTRSAVGRAAVAVGVLALGEISASKLAATPGDPTFAHDLWARMHYGVNNYLAAMCLLLLAVAVAPTVLLTLFQRRASGTGSAAYQPVATDRR